MQYHVTITGRDLVCPTTVDLDIPSNRREPFQWAAMKSVGLVRPEPNTIVYAKGEQLGGVREFGVYRGRPNQKPISVKMTIRVERVEQAD